MIKSWMLENFKSVSEEVTLDFAPLTIFAGANSSGKSTIIQSILLVCQTLQNSVPSKSVVLNGNILRFGTFNDIISDTRVNNNISLGFVLKPAIGTNEDWYFNYANEDRKIEPFPYTCKFSFTSYGYDEKNELFQLQPQLVYSNLINPMTEIEIKRSEKSSINRLKELKVKDQPNIKNELSSLEYEVIKPNKIIQDEEIGHSKKHRGEKYVGANVMHFLPDRLSVIYDNIKEEKSILMSIFFSKSDYFVSNNRFKEVFDKYLNDKIEEEIVLLADEAYKEMSEGLVKVRFKRFLDPLKNNFTYETFRRLMRDASSSRTLFPKLEENQNELFKLLNFKTDEDIRLTFARNIYLGSDYIDFYFKRSIKYLGPLRDEPKSIYPLSGTSDSMDIGFKGENTAAVLELHKDTKIYYIPTSYFENELSDKILKQVTLFEAVLDWLTYMGVAEKVDTADKGKFGHELKIRTIGSVSLHDLTNVGVGVSQVLPILVLSLIAQIDSVLIFEQPELHLHPKVQTRLADFFASMTMLNKQCIVETHSEYLINRLRYQIAKSSDEELTNSIILYFVEKDSKTSKYKKIQINKYGVIPDWPKGFFDENEENAASILKAGMDKKNRERLRNE